MRLSGKIAFISGGVRGIGAATTELFIHNGACVVFGDILEEEGRQTEKRLRKIGANVIFVPLDVTSESDWKNAITKTVEKFGKLDIMVNNAGISGIDGTENTTTETWDAIMSVNAKGVFLGTKVAIPEMRRIGGGSIINISSQMGIVGSPTSSPAYQASKGAIRTFTKSVAIRHAKENIRVNSVHPGPILTPMTQDRIGKVGATRKSYVDRVPLGRIGTAKEVAYGIVYLASDESSYVTGTELIIDGGWTAQ
jgi:NAD(P)-dependent dehydrogenase (short-subunit alcohol dehydrogenase family)